MPVLWFVYFILYSPWLSIAWGNTSSSQSRHREVSLRPGHPPCHGDPVGKGTILEVTFPTPSQATESTLRAPSSARSVVWLGVLIFLVLFIAFSFYVFVSLRPQGVVTDLSTFCQHDILYTMCWQVMRLLMMWWRCTKPESWMRLLQWRCCQTSTRSPRPRRVRLPQSRCQMILLRFRQFRQGLHSNVPKKRRQVRATQMRKLKVMISNTSTLCQLLSSSYLLSNPQLVCAHILKLLKLLTKV